MRTWLVLGAAISILASSCNAPPGRSTDATELTGSSTPKRINAAIMSSPAGISRVFIDTGSGTYPGGDALEELVNAGLTRADSQGNLQPQLAEAVPNLDNQLWKVFADGRMETTWRIRPNATWHDGTPITSADVLFDAQLERDRDLPIFTAREWDFAEAIEAPDPRTVTIKWKQTFIRADTMFPVVRPRHILEPPYLEDKLSIPSNPYWTDQHVGAGPFKLRQWQRDSYAMLDSFDQYVLGRPKVDQILVKFIANPNTLAANILAGEVEFTMGRNISLQQAIQLQDHWTGGTIDIGITNWIALYPQFINPTPAVLANLEFRRALVQSIDRQQLVDTLLYGKVPVAHAFLSPTDPVYKSVESQIVKYDYDLRRAAQLVEGLGYSKGADGLYRDPSGGTVPLEVRTSGGDDTHEAGVFTVADSLKRLGLDSTTYLIPQDAREDRGANVSYPALRLWRLPNGRLDLTRYTSAEAGTPENQFRRNSNRARYMNPDFDALIDRYMSTISERDRDPILGQIVHHQTDQVTVMGLWYNAETIVVNNRIRNVENKRTEEATLTWSAHNWDVR